MLINLSNHPFEKWSDKQKVTALKRFEHIENMEFPQINPYADSKEILKLADTYFKKCKALLVDNNGKNNAVHLMGEFTFVFALANMLIDNNITCVVSTTERNTVDLGNKKISEFKFVKFREYVKLK